MYCVIQDIAGNEVKISFPSGGTSGLQFDITMNDGSDPTKVQLLFDDKQKDALGSAIDFFSY